MAYESAIRDALAADLSILEPGLVLVRTEFPIARTPDGTRGSLDILVRDALGHYVIIEVKRSDQSARQALHELEKYMGVLPFHLKVPAYQIRCLLVSTEWRELRRPYSNFRTHFPHALDGYDLEIDASGKPIRARKVEPLTPLPPPELSEDHTLFLFLTAERRDAALQPIARSLKRNELGNAFIIAMNHTAADPRVIYRFAVYVAYYKISEPEDDDEAARRAAELASHIDGSPNAFATSFEELLICRVLNDTWHLQDDLEQGSRKKLGTMLHDWSVVGIRRLGEAPLIEVASDPEVLDLVVGVTEGVHPLGLKRYVSPRFDPDWRAARGHVRRVLGDAQVWREAADAFLEGIARELPDAKVAIEIYVVDNLLLAFRERALNPERGALPYVEIVAEGEAETRALFGVLMWDGVTWPQTATEMLETLEARHNGLWSADVFGRGFRRYTDEILALHGVGHGLLEYRAAGGDLSASIVALGPGSALEVIKKADPHDPNAWFSAHSDYFRDLVAALRTRALLI